MKAVPFVVTMALLASVALLAFIVEKGGAEPVISQPDTVQTEDQPVAAQPDTVEPKPPSVADKTVGGEGKPKVVLVSPEELAREQALIQKAEQAVGDTPPQPELARFLDEAIRRSERQPLDIVILGTDSKDGGLDGWRTCAKFGLTQLQLPPDTMVNFHDQHGRPCAENPNGHVARIFLAVPSGLSDKLAAPTYQNEKMVLTATTLGLKFK